MNIYKREDYWKCIRIKPEGWVDDLVFETGFSNCGQANGGMGIRINNQAGGVLTHDDMIAIRNHINEHLKKQSEQV